MKVIFRLSKSPDRHLVPKPRTTSFSTKGSPVTCRTPRRLRGPGGLRTPGLFCSHRSMWFPSFPCMHGVRNPYVHCLHPEYEDVRILYSDMMCILDTYQILLVLSACQLVHICQVTFTLQGLSLHADDAAHREVVGRSASSVAMLLH